MKVLFLANKTPFPPIDGGSIATFGLMQAFADAGHQVTVLTMNTRKHHITPYEIPESVSAKITFHLVEVPATINAPDALKNLLFSSTPYNAERFINKKFSQKLQKLLQSQQFDIIQLEGLYLWPYIKTIRQYSEAKIAYRSHNIEQEIWERLLANSKGLKRIYLKQMVQRLKRFEQSAINTYDLLVPITARDGEQLNKMGNTKPIQVIPAGINLQQVEIKSTLNPFDLFFIGALDWAPNQEGLLWFIDKCRLLLLKKYPETRLTIAGRNSPQWLVDKLNLPNISYLGEVPDASKYMQQHGIMIVPLLSGSGMRVKIIEAMGHCKPIVSTSIGCEGINVQNKKQIMLADTPSNFVEAIVQLIQQPKLATQIANNSLTFVKENFSNQQLAEKLLAFYRKQIL